MKGLWLKIASVPLFILLLCSCGGTSYEYEAPDDNLGPGLFSGEDGTFTIYKNQKEVEVEEKEEAEKKK